jgi:hypothetical protein
MSKGVNDKMKRLNVNIEDELMLQAKMYVAKHGITLKDLVTDLLLAKFNSNEENFKGVNETILINSKEETIVKAPKPQINETVHIPSNEDILIDSYEPEIDYDDPFSDPDPMDERYFYILGKTYRTAPLEEHEVLSGVSNGTLRWAIPERGLKHFDKNNHLIPFRYTDADGRVFEPSEYQLEVIAEKYDKQGVTVEV